MVCPRLIVVTLHYRNRSFAESKNLWREPSFGLSAKNSSLRVKKLSQKLSVNKFFAESQEKTLGEEFFAESKPTGSR
jgi:hypothetical protein